MDDVFNPLCRHRATLGDLPPGWVGLAPSIEVHPGDEPAGIIEVPPVIAEVIAKALQAETELLDTVLGAALTGGLHGVRVDYDPDTGLLRCARVDPAVPYGEIHEHRGGHP